MSSIRVVRMGVVVFSVAFASLIGVVPQVAAQADGRVPAIGPGLAERAAALGLQDGIEVVVTADSFEGLDVLDQMGIVNRRLRSAPIAFSTPTVEQLQQLAGNPALRSLWPREQFDLFLSESTQIVGADRVERLLGIDGSGVIVAVVDTGIDAQHPDLPWHEKVLGNFEVAANPFDPQGTLFVDLPDTDDDSHGTHVSSTVAGNDADGGHANDGVAPGAKLYGYSVNVSLTIDSARSLAAFDDVIQRRLAGEPIVAISNSWGGGPGDFNPDAPLSVLSKAAYDAGVAVVFAAGNSGQENGELDTASSQCTMPWVICVGATTKPGQLVQFSSRGRPPVDTAVTMPDGDEFAVRAGNHDRKLGQTLGIGVFRPTVSAPGVNIVAACAKSACGVEGDYQSLSGTSMATPHVSGVVALIGSAALATTGSPGLPTGQLIDLLERTANPMPGWQLWETGAGEVDAYEAVKVVAGAAKAALANFGARPAPLGAPAVQTFTGTAGPMSWDTGVGVGEHQIDVPAGTARLDLTLTWSGEENNLYMFAWRAGTDPDAAGADRADQESWGLLEGLGPRLQTFRKGTIPSPEPGTWTVRVYGRVNALPVDYSLEAETSPAPRPTVTVRSASIDRSGNARLSGSATFPARPDEGLTRQSVLGSTLPVRVPGTPVQYFLHGTVGEVDKHAQFFFGGPGPFFDTNPPTSPVSQFQEGGWYGNPDFAGNFLLAYWRAPFQGPIQGDVPVTMWISSLTEQLGGQVTFTLFDVPEGELGTGFPVVARVTVSGAGIGPAPTRVDAVFEDVVYTFGTGRELVLSVSGTFVDADYFTVWYDSTLHPSGFTLPVLLGSDLPLRPGAVTATDLPERGVNLSWPAVTGATSYVVYRSESPDALGKALAEVTTTAHNDTSLKSGDVAYYRVAARNATGEGEASDVVYGIPVIDRLWVQARAGRGPWEVASGAASWRITLPPAAGPGSDPATFVVRSMSWAGASTEVAVQP